MISLRGLQSWLRPNILWAFEVAEYNGLAPIVTSGYRGRADQLKLYRDSLGGSKYPANPPGLSGHNYGLAWDSWVPDHQMATWTAIREAAGFRVPPNDLIHAEVPSWASYVRLR